MTERVSDVGLAGVDKVPSGGKPVKPPVYLCENHVHNQAVTLKDDCGSRWNLGWICRRHGRLDFKVRGAKGIRRYLIGEIHSAGGNVKRHPHYAASCNGATCHQGGSGYEGGIVFGTVDDAVRYLKRWFTVKACIRNKTATQAWINTL